ncbi:MAG: hydrogenase maturation protease [Simkania sp.]|nr:hydrogenase maturation protease [Simkania sp.]
MDNLLVIGIGNPFRGDDGIGWAVVAALMGKVPAEIQLRKSRGDIAELIELFSMYRAVYLIDACRMDAAPGVWQRIDAHLQPLLLDNTQTSTHGISISQAIALAKTLHQLPSTLIVYAINGDRYNISTTLSPPVAQVIDTVAEHILKEKGILECMKKA